MTRAPTVRLTREQKEEIKKAVHETDLNATEVAQAMSINPSAVHYWFAKFRARKVRSKEDFIPKPVAAAATTAAPTTRKRDADYYRAAAAFFDTIYVK